MGFELMSLEAKRMQARLDVSSLRVKKLKKIAKKQGKSIARAKCQFLKPPTSEEDVLNPTQQQQQQSGSKKKETKKQRQQKN
uniref:Uncharacterized protein n=1 Tax=Panagrolaimus sp. ES5 TaxID=591445 RepID=A0AC34GIF2_9BILA